MESSTTAKSQVDSIKKVKDLQLEDTYLLLSNFCLLHKHGMDIPPPAPPFWVRHVVTTFVINESEENNRFLEILDQV